jgi:hypothetical protein
MEIELTPDGKLPQEIVRKALIQASDEHIFALVRVRGYATPVKREIWSAVMGEIMAYKAENAYLRSQKPEDVGLGTRLAVTGELLGIHQELERLATGENVEAIKELIGAIDQLKASWEASFQ